MFDEPFLGIVTFEQTNVSSLVPIAINEVSKIFRCFPKGPHMSILIVSHVSYRE